MNPEIKEYLRAHVQQLWTPDEDDRDYSTPEEVIARRTQTRRRGRPTAYRSNNKKTLHSVMAAFFVLSEMIRYRSRKRVRRVPRTLRIELLKIAQQLYPTADEGLVVDHIRMHRKEFDLSLIEEYDFLSELNSLR